MDKSHLKHEYCYSKVENCHFDSQNRGRKVQSVILEQFGSCKIRLSGVCYRFAANMLISTLNLLQCFTGIPLPLQGSNLIVNLLTAPHRKL